MTEPHLSDNQISEYALQLMDTDRRGAAEAHLSRCVVCAAQVASVEAALSLASATQVPVANTEQVEASWQVILDHVAAAANDESAVSSVDQAQAPSSGGVPTAAGDRTEPHRTGWVDWFRPVFAGMPTWSLQMAQVVILAGLGFAAAWYLAGQGWLPGTQPPQEITQEGSSPSVDSTRSWLAANGYAEQLEVLLLDLAHGDDRSGAALTPTVKEVSRNLLTDARWYRRAADRSGDPVLTELLSEIELLLLAVATVPDGQEGELVAILRDLIDEQDLLWRLRSVRPGEASPTDRDPVAIGTSG